LKRLYLRIFLVFLLGLAVRFFVVSTLRVTSNSMAPALLPGDLVWATKLSYRIDFPKLGVEWFSDDIQRGELALFFYSDQPKIHYIQRIVALPGDVVQMKAGFLYINDKKCKKERVTQERPSSVPGETDSVEVRLGGWALARESCFGGPSHLILEDPQHPVDFPLLVVPMGEVLLLPDRRERGPVQGGATPSAGVALNPEPEADPWAHWDAVPIRNLQGRAALVFFSMAPPSSQLATGGSAETRWRVRWDRLFTRL
jgi:signal peptidase I